jgi:raffinose/stachyose/melibiose transport system substrate-binding protein
MSLSHAARHPRRFAMRIAGAATAVVMASALAGCATDASSGKSEITFLSWDNAEIMEPIIAAFEEENPDYTVTAQYAPPVAQYVQKLQTQLGSGTAPDVFIITAENKKQLIDSELVQDLGGEPWADNLAEAARDTYTRDGKLYGSAISSWAGGLVVNEQILTDAGVTEFPTNWADFLKLCKELEAAGVTPYLEPVDNVTVTLGALLGLQNEAYDGTMDQQIWDGELTFEEAWTPAVETWYELFEAGVLDSSAAGLKYDQVLQEFQQGRVAMMSTGSWAMGGIVDGAPDLDFAFKAVPGPESEPYWLGAVSPGLAINAKAKNTEGAKVFLEWMSTEPGVRAYQDETKTITTTKDFEPSLPTELGELVPAAREGEFYLPVVSWIDHNDVLAVEATALIQQLAAGQISPQDVGKGMDAKLASVQ